MRLEQLQAIIEIEKHQSISKAAKALYMGQPALSNTLNALEEELGVRLFERDAKVVTPTPEGKDILQLAKQMLDCRDQMLNYGKTCGELYGEVTVLTTHAYSFLFTDIMLAFKEKYPKASLNLQIRNPEEVVAEVSSGKANIGLTLWEFLPGQDREAVKQAALQYETFGTHNMMVFVSQDNRFAEHESVELGELQAEQFVSYSSAYWAHANKIVQAKNDALVMSDRENLKRLVSTGQAIAMLPDTFGLRDLYCDQGMIKLIPIKGSENFGTGVDYLLYPAKRRLTLLEQNTVKLLREVLTDVMM